MTCDYSRRARILYQVLQVLARDELVNFLMLFKSEMHAAVRRIADI